jgi:hypothetical protein
MVIYFGFREIGLVRPLKDDFIAGLVTAGVGEDWAEFLFDLMELVSGHCVEEVISSEEPP